MGVWQSVRRGGWLTSERLIPAGWMASAAYGLLLAYLFVWPGPLSTEGLTATLNDFLSFWSAARLAVAGDSVTPYVFADFAEFQKSIRGGDHVFSFFYPPVFLLYLLPLGLMGGVAAYVLFEVVTLAAAGFVATRIMGSWQGMLLAIGLPMSFVNAFYGQNGFLSAALLGGALLALFEGRQILSGILIGLMIYKPQMGLLVPLALLAGGYWRAIVSAAITCLVLFGLSLLVFGVETWEAFWQQRAFAARVLADGLVDGEKLVSFTAAALMLGMDLVAAYALQLVVALVVAALVMWSWRKPNVDMADKVTLLVTGGLIATPFALVYDLCVLMVPLAYWAARRKIQPPLPFEDVFLCLVVFLSLGSRFLGEATGVPLGPLPLVLMIGLSIRRITWPVCRIEANRGPSA